MRLFFAFDVPDAENARVQEVVSALAPKIPEARWVPQPNRHVTVRFLGEVTDDQLGAVKAAARRATASVEPGDIYLEGIGAFPRASRSRVLWAGVKDPSETAANLFRHLDEELSQCGFRGEERSYTPHLTLARMKAPISLPGECVSMLPPGESFLLDSLLLMASRLSPGGAHYEVKDLFPLG